MSDKKMRPLTPKQIAMLVLIGGCVYMIVLCLSLTVLSAVHEAVRVRAGEGDSWWYAISTVIINPLAIAALTCFALRCWKEYGIPDEEWEQAQREPPHQTTTSGGE